MRKLSPVVAPLVVVAAVVLLGGASAPSPKEEALWRHRNLGKALFETPTSVAQSAAELKKALDLAPESFANGVNDNRSATSLKRSVSALVYPGPLVRVA